MSHALNEKDVNYFIHDLEAELRAMYLIRDALKLPLDLTQFTELETNLLNLPKKEVLSIIKYLRKKFPYVESKKD
jgi:hypothetical protein